MRPSNSTTTQSSTSRSTRATSSPFSSRISTCGTATIPAMLSWQRVWLSRRTPDRASTSASIERTRPARGHRRTSSSAADSCSRVTARECRAWSALTTPATGPESIATSTSAWGARSSGRATSRRQGRWSDGRRPLHPGAAILDHRRTGRLRSAPDTAAPCARTALTPVSAPWGRAAAARRTASGAGPRRPRRVEAAACRRPGRVLQLAVAGELDEVAREETQDTGLGSGQGTALTVGEVDDLGGESAHARGSAARRRASRGVPVLWMAAPTARRLWTACGGTRSPFGQEGSTSGRDISFPRSSFPPWAGKWGR